MLELKKTTFKPKKDAQASFLHWPLGNSEVQAELLSQCFF